MRATITLPLSLAFIQTALAAPGTVIKRTEPAPLLIPRGSIKALIPNQYIVKLNDGMSISALDDTIGILSEGAEHVYNDAFKGFAGKLDKDTLDALRHHPDASSSFSYSFSFPFCSRRLILILCSEMHSNDDFVFL